MLDTGIKKNAPSLISGAVRSALTSMDSPLTSRPKSILTSSGDQFLGKCYQFNWFLIERGITSISGSAAHITCASTAKVRENEPAPCGQRPSVRLDDTAALFVNGENNRLTRFGVRYIVAHRVAEAAKVCPSLLTRKVTPHTWRHCTSGCNDGKPEYRHGMHED